MPESNPRPTASRLVAAKQVQQTISLIILKITYFLGFLISYHFTYQLLLHCEMDKSNKIKLNSSLPVSFCLYFLLLMGVTVALQ